MARAPLFAVGCALVLAACAPEESESRAVASAAAYRVPPLSAVRLTDSFWRPRLERNRTVTIPHILRQNEATGRVANFERAAGRAEGAYSGRRFNDTDVYKLIEAASYTLARTPDAALEAALDELVELIAAAQEEDGYLMPARTIDPRNPAPGLGRERWVHVSTGSHELYNAGHLIEAAVAHRHATGKRTLLDVAVRLADRIDEDFGLDTRRAAPGHEEIELALVALAEAVDEPRYLALARFFLDQRGREHDGEPYPEDTPFALYNDRRYRQDHQRVTAQTEAVGHAVRATYLYSGMADVAARTEAPGYEEALERVWRDLVETKLYLTGGIGSRDTFESFGEPWELPNATAYAETCAAIGNDLWNHRMFLASGRADFLDVVERVLYNGFLSGVSLSGDRFFYTNPLASDGGVERASYFEVACCPANLARMMARLPTFLYAVRGTEVVVALYAASEAELSVGGSVVRVEQVTRYPWSGRVELTLTPAVPRELTLTLRLPGWALERPMPSDLYRFRDDPAPTATLAVEGSVLSLAGGRHALPSGGEVAVAGGFARVRRLWSPGDSVTLELPMPVRRVVAHPEVEADAGRLALQRGPLVYAVEGIDHGGTLAGLRLPVNGGFSAAWRPDLLGGVVVVTGMAERVGEDGATAGQSLVAVPYFAWANRGAGEMAVWLPGAEGETDAGRP